MNENDSLTMKMELPRIPSSELVAIEGLNLLAHQLDIADEKLGEARILVTEAIINALEYAGEENPKVQVEFTASKEKLIIFVRDYGEGFDPTSIEEPDIKAKLGTGHKRGWGLKLMKTMSDDFLLESSKDGTKITLTKKFV